MAELSLNYFIMRKWKAGKAGRQKNLKAETSKEENWLRARENTGGEKKNLPKDLVIKITDEGESLNQDLWLQRGLTWPKVKVKPGSLTSSSLLLARGIIFPSGNCQEQS